MFIVLLQRYHRQIHISYNFCMLFNFIPHYQASRGRFAAGQRWRKQLLTTPLQVVVRISLENVTPHSDHSFLMLLPIVSQLFILFDREHTE